MSYLEVKINYKLPVTRNLPLFLTVDTIIANRLSLSEVYIIDIAFSLIFNPVEQEELPDQFFAPQRVTAGQGCMGWGERHLTK